MAFPISFDFVIAYKSFAFSMIKQKKMIYGKAIPVTRFIKDSDYQIM